MYSLRASYIDNIKMAEMEQFSFQKQNKLGRVRTNFQNCFFAHVL